MSKPNDSISDELLARYIAHSATSEEMETIENWLKEFPEAKTERDHYRLIWERSATIHAKEDRQKVDKAWAKVQQKMHPKQGSDDMDVRPIVGGGNGSKVKWYPLLAMVLGVAAVLLLVFRFNDQRPDTAIEMVRVATQEQTKSLLMPDGSQVFLNHNSSLEYPAEWAGNQRQVNLVGEAFFEVQPDASRPFVIHTSQGEVKVLGTSFNVRAVETMPMRVDVVTGKVQLTTALAKRVLVKGQGAEVSGDTIQSLAANANIFGYKTQIYDFNASHLNEIVHRIREGYHADVRLARSSLSDCRLTIRFEKEPLDTTLAVIAETLQLSLRKDGEIYWLEGAGCK